MPSYTRRQIALLLTLVAAVGAGLAVSRWRQSHLDLVEQLEAFDQTPPEAGPAALPPSRRSAPSAASSLKRFQPAPEPGRTAEPVDVNQATAADLRRLPGIGPVLASRIVESRDAQGPFTTIEDLRRVSGIGKSKLERFRTLVTVSR
jgi:competence ComEA-like helix-hairpin-helix protein